MVVARLGIQCVIVLPEPYTEKHDARDDADVREYLDGLSESIFFIGIRLGDIRSIRQRKSRAQSAIQIDQFGETGLDQLLQ
jgi:hypothetical protein